MAEILDSFNFRDNGQRGVYPWDEWLDGQVRRLERGVDFVARTEAVRSGAHQQAKKRGGNCRTSINDDQSIVIQFIPGGA